LRSLILQRRNRGLPTFAAFIDIRKAYDTVPIEALMAQLDHIGVRGQCLEWLQYLYANSMASVLVGGQLSDAFPLNRGVRQGCPMSPTLFNIFINDILAGCDPYGIPIGNTSTVIPGLLFADDLVILAPSAEALQCSLDLVSQWASYHEMSFGIKKCGVIPFTPAPYFQHHWSLQNQALPVVDSYCYLGIDIRQDLSLSPWLEKKASKARKAYYAIRPVLQCHSIPVWIRVLMVRTLIESRLRYGCELHGSNQAANRPLQQVLTMALKSVIGSPKSKNSIYGANALYDEFKVPPIAASAAVAMCRALDKYRTLATFVPEVLSVPQSRPGTLYWASLVRRWVSRFRIDLASKSLKSDVLHLLRERATKTDSTLSWAQALNARYISTRSFHLVGLLYPQLSQGFTWVIRLRLNAVWTGYRAASAGLIPPFYRAHCVACCAPVQPTAHIAHLLFDCRKFYAIRESSGLADLIHQVRQQFSLASGDDALPVLLLGGETRGMTIGPYWDGSLPQIADPSAPPGCVVVATFAQEVFSQYSRMLWSQKLPTSTGRRPPCSISNTSNIT
jgi:hypothetical protein